MRRLSLSILLLSLSLVLCDASRATAWGDSLPARLHPWALFEPGSWKVVRVTTETLDEHSIVVGTSVADTTTTLLDVDDQGVTLETEACLQVAGKCFSAEPQIIEQGFHGELLSPDTKLLDSIDGNVVIEGHNIPCKIQQIECAGPKGKTVTRLYYSPTVAPYVFKRDSVTTNPDGKVTNETTKEVTSSQTSREVLNELKTCFSVKTVSKNDTGMVTTLAVISPEIPGGVVSHKATEVDKEGRLVRRSVLELRAYSTDPQTNRNIYSRKRSSHRRSKTVIRYGQ